MEDGGGLEVTISRASEPGGGRATTGDPRRAGIRGAHVWLRPVEPDDAEVLADWFADGEFRRLLGEPPLARATRRARLERDAREANPATTDVFQLLILRLEDGAPIGRADIFGIDRVNGSAALGIGIGPREARGRGYGSDAVNAIVDFCFGELRLERVWLETDAENVAAQATYRRCGFSEEARLRAAFVDRGRQIDGIRMSILRAEWLALSRKRSWDWAAEGR